MLLLGFHEVGFRLAGGRKVGSEAAAQAGAVMSAVLALLSLMLAFNFGMAGTRFDARRQAVLDEANAIGTTWDRSFYLPDPQSAAVRQLLEHYVRVRLEATRSTTPGELERAIEDSEALHERLREHSVTLSLNQPQSLPVALFVESLSELIDLHERRVTYGIRYRMDGGVWLALYFIAFVSMIVAGAHARLTGDRSLRLAALLAVSLSAAIAVTIDLDRDRQTLFSVTQDSLLDLEGDLARRRDADD